MMMNRYLSDFERNKILSNPDVKQRILMISGDKKDSKLELTQEQQKQVAVNFSKMFSGLVVINWCRGLKLGMAKQKALEQMSAYVKSKTNPEHPMNKYLHALDNQYRREVSEEIMKSEHSEEILPVNADWVKKWEKLATDDFNISMQQMNQMHKEFMPQKTPEKQFGAKSFEEAKDKAYQKMLLILQQQIQDDYQRAA